MEQFYKLPEYWNLIILNNFYIFEIYLLVFVWIFLFLFFNKYELKNLIFIIFWVFLYKYLTLSIFGNSDSGYLNSYFPSLSTINVFIWMLSIAEVGLWIYVANKLIEKKKKDKKSLYNKKNVFVITVLFTYIFAIFNEIIIRILDLRIYAPDLEKSLSGYSFLTIPLESYIYILVGIILIVWIYDYLDKIFKIKKLKEIKASFFKYFYISFVWMFLIEILVHPIFQNTGLPSFTYIYQDINWLLTIIWALGFSTVIYLIDNVFKKYKFKITKVEYIIFNLFVLFILNLIVFNILFSSWIISLTPLASSYLWGVNILWLPFEVFSGVFVTNILVFMFVKSRLIK